VTADLLGWSSTMTDTREIPAVRPLTEDHFPTVVLHPVFDLPPAPVPVPQRLPKRLRRRAAAHLALAFTAAAGFATALVAGGVLS
jgi:hypothetical protein